jgi:hypothetical protein
MVAAGERDFFAFAVDCLFDDCKIVVLRRIPVEVVAFFEKVDST